ncbi:hypothetical protein SODALDRAFT_355431 [Sodiomyces alkalinus F11]|uniref:Uncharacterized protein n=1 Tax=Sodiomyces alkalinus (strain CBS 110278 / VKM F-3762 / F11) TaxID=1314773 RepID=A0A3N2Q952_SODAK|nr:hypothetical protein SODALDRAFT_355431 [Sodiomyces alkalinus F11]ROT43227.1 hypothetical protein SODALDRAFT_355431 [Sodiomyces alkalinus F11]
MSRPSGIKSQPVSSGGFLSLVSSDFPCHVREREPEDPLWPRKTRAGWDDINNDEPLVRLSDCPTVRNLQPLTREAHVAHFLRISACSPPSDMTTVHGVYLVLVPNSSLGVYNVLRTTHHIADWSHYGKILQPSQPTEEPVPVVCVPQSQATLPLSVAVFLPPRPSQVPHRLILFVSPVNLLNCADIILKPLLQPSLPCDVAIAHSGFRQFSVDTHSTIAVPNHTSATADHQGLPIGLCFIRGLPQPSVRSGTWERWLDHLAP